MSSTFAAHQHLVILYDGITLIIRILKYRESFSFPPSTIVIGFGAACDVALKEIEYDKKYIDFLSKRLYDHITSRLSHGTCNGDPEQTYSGLLILSLLMALKDVALSSASACTSASLEPSYVLCAIGTDEDLAHSSIRFGIGRFTTIEVVDYIAVKCIKHVERLREMSPLWEMVQEPIDLKNIQWSRL
ncbi:cysteine desulfurase, mitochondrial-like [Eurosta solidaginis]|uniref:cysteine desulfurase, mitochondrial-like n=1 Tax=Eurosta solidaginis TaxID=178769 RepID=UPI0035307731